MAPKRKRNDNSETYQQTKLQKVQTASDVQNPSKRPQNTVILSQTSPSTKASSSTNVATIESYVLEKATEGVVHVTDLKLQTAAGQKGLVHLKLDLASSTLSIASISDQSLSYNVDAFGSPSIASQATALTTHTFSDSRDESKCGFLKLPAELRDVIYADVFVTKKVSVINPFLTEDRNLSAAFLRTCRQVYNEGRKWLYAENSFSIGRDPRQHGGPWEIKWSSLGYTTMHTFLKTIGKANINFLRDVRIYLNNETRSRMPKATADERRYIHDKELRGIVQLLAEHSHLQSVRVNLDGRSKVKGRKSEMSFFKLLCGIKADHVAIYGPYGTQPAKIDANTLAFLRKSMQRPNDPQGQPQSNSEGLRKEMRSVRFT